MSVFWIRLPIMAACSSGGNTARPASSTAPSATAGGTQVQVGGSNQGYATLPLVDTQRRQLTDPAAWDHDWQATSVIVGADLTESRETRERVRRWARLRMDRPAEDAFLAEILASESAY